MKIVSQFYTNVLSLFAVQVSTQTMVLGLAFLCLSSQLFAQDEKKVSYPVNLQIERPASSAAAAAIKPVEQTQEDAIRSLYEKASTSSPARKVTKQQAEKSTTKTTKAADNKTRSKSKSSASKRDLTNKPAQKPVVKPERPLPAPSVVNTLIENKNLVPAAAAAPEILPVANTITETGATANVEGTVLPDPTTSLAPLPAAEVIDDEDPSALAADNVLTDGTAVRVPIGDDAPPNTESTPTQPGFVDPNAGAPAAPVVSAVKKIPLPTSNVREAYINEFKKYVEDKIVPRVPGMALAVIADGKVKVLQAYGVKKVGSRDFIDTDTAFRLASVSKTIAGTTAGILVNDGVLSWTTPVVSVLPHIQFSNPRYGNQISLRDILSQSTGLPTHSGDNYIEEGLPFDSVVAKLKSVNFVCPPGKCYAYQNVSFSLFDGMVRSKTGKPYEQYVQEKLFNPLGMQTASFGLAGLKAHNNFALPHVATSKGWYTEKITENYYRMHPAAGANASITDMARWVLAQMGHNPEVLTPAVRNSVHDKVTKNTPSQSHYGAREGVTDTHYGIGWRVFDYRGDKNFLHHGGYVLGFQSQMVFNAELQIGMVALSNSNRMPPNIIFDFLDAYEDEKRGPRKMILPSISPVAKKRPAQKGR